MRFIMGMILVFVVFRIFTEIIYLMKEADILKIYHVPPALPFVKISKYQIFTENELPPYPRYLNPTDAEWQTVSRTKHRFYVYSAFFDSRKGRRSEVRIIAATKRVNPEKVFCRLWYEPTEEDPTVSMSKTIAAEIKVIPEHYSLYYSACFVVCPIQRNQTVPLWVSVVAEVLYPPTNLLIVNDNYNATKPVNKFGACVKPLVKNDNKALPILEFLELSRILGISHFTLYNHTISPQVDCLLKDYISRDIVTVYPWQFEITALKKIRLCNMFAALNDCLYRSMYRFSHILVIDLDEYIIPRQNDSLPQLIHYLEQQQKSGQQLSVGSYCFQNAFFYLDWDDSKYLSETNETIAANLFTLKKTRRTAQLNYHGTRSKYICKPERVVDVGNHFVWQFTPGYYESRVPADIAILHHFRAGCEPGNMKNCLKVESIIDTTAFRYSDSLIGAVQERFSYLKDRCGLADLKAS